jgi:hypothetical protein
MAKYGPAPAGTTWADWKDFDEAFVARCDFVFVLMLPGWRKSTGVTAELLLSRKLNIPIMGVDPVTHDVVPFTEQDLEHLPEGDGDGNEAEESISRTAPARGCDVGADVPVGTDSAEPSGS